MDNDGPYFVVLENGSGSLVERSSTDPLILIPKASGSLSDMKMIARKLNQAVKEKS